MAKAISRREAARKGFSRFYTGKPCRNGHDAERYVSSGICVACSEMHRKNIQREIKELQAAARAEAQQAQAEVG